MSASINVNTTNVMFRKSYLFEGFKQKFRSNAYLKIIIPSASQIQTFCHHSNLMSNDYAKIRPWHSKFVQELRARGCRRNLSFTNAHLSCARNQIFKHKEYFLNHPNVKNLSQIHYFHSTRVSLHESRECWKCGRHMNDPAELFYCKCGIVQKPASNLTYFQLFGLNEDFDVDLKPLSGKYIELQKQLHPDKFSQASETEKGHAADQSSLVNKAYSVLAKPLHRAIYMLELHDNPIEESSAISDPEFLMEIMELNEELADVDSPEELKIIEEQNESKIDQSIQDISAAFKCKNIQSAHELVIKLQYYNNITEKVKNLRRSWMK